jgi:hypothetical protein
MTRIGTASQTTLPTAYDTHGDHDSNDNRDQSNCSEEVAEIPYIKGANVSQHERVPQEESVAQ